LRAMLEDKDQELNSMAESFNKLMVKNKRLEQRLAAFEASAKENKAQQQQQATATAPDAVVPEKKRSSLERPEQSVPVSPQTKRQHK